jgi:hypothetical protein
MGIIIYLYNYALIDFNPPISSKVVDGISEKPYFLRIGCMYFNECVKLSKVKTIGDFFDDERMSNPDYFNNMTKSAAIKPEVHLASYSIC